MVWGSMLWQGSSVLCQQSIIVIRHWEWKFMEFSYLQVLILFSLYLEILQVLQKSGREYYDLPYLKFYIKSGILCWYHAVENIANQHSGIQCTLDGIAPTPLSVCCDLIPAKIKHVIPFLVYFKCCLSHVRTKFFPQH